MYRWMDKDVVYVYNYCCCSVTKSCLFATPWTATHQAPLSSTVSSSLFKFISIVSVILSNQLILCYPLLLLSSIFPSTRVFFSESALRTRWTKCWSFGFNISPSNEYLGVVSFGIDRVLSPCCPRDSQESSPAPQSKSINSLVLSFLYGPTLTSTHDYWKNYSFDDMDLCWQSDVSAF